MVRIDLPKGHPTKELTEEEQDLQERILIMSVLAKQLKPSDPDKVKLEKAINRRKDKLNKGRGYK